MEYKSDRKVKATLIVEIEYNNVGSYAALEKHLQNIGESLKSNDTLINSGSALTSWKYDYKMKW